jgi:hypothetical protein
VTAGSGNKSIMVISGGAGIVSVAPRHQCLGGVKKSPSIEVCKACFYREAEPGEEFERKYLPLVDVARELEVEFTLGTFLDNRPVFEEYP